MRIESSEIVTIYVIMLRRPFVYSHLNSLKHLINVRGVIKSNHIRVTRSLVSTDQCIVRSDPIYDIPELAQSQGNVSQWLMKDFMKPNRKNLEAICDGHTERFLSYEQVYTQTHSFAFHLKKLLDFQPEISQGDIIAVMSPNHLHYFSVWVGISLTGAASTTINPSYLLEEVKHQLTLTKARAIIAHPMCLNIAKKAATECGIQVIVMDAPTDANSSLPKSISTPVATSIPDSYDGLLKLSDMLNHPLTKSEKLFINKPFNCQSLATVPFSSGTTGLAKGVMLTHSNITKNVLQLNAFEGKYLLPENSKSGQRGVHICPLPFYHIFGMVVCMLAPLVQGAKLVFLSSFDLKVFLSCIQNHKVSRGSVVPPIILALAKHPMVNDFRLDSLETLMSGAAPLGAEVQEMAAKRLNCTIKQAWGMTELSPGGSTFPDTGLPSSLAKRSASSLVGYSGLLLPGTEAKLCDPVTGDDLPSTSEGELLIRGPQVMKGYLHNTKATNDTLRADGWMHTGDIASFSEEGMLKITDRLKELIKVSGFQVPPAELEALILTIPQVQDVIVIPILDDTAGELPRAYVVLQPNAKLSEEEIKQYVEKRVVHYKRLRGGVKFVQSIPKSPSGKLLRRVQIQMDRASSTK